MLLLVTAKECLLYSILLKLVCYFYFFSNSFNLSLFFFYYSLSSVIRRETIKDILLNKKFKFMSHRLDWELSE